jgi:hypothetical protein
LDIYLFYAVTLVVYQKSLPGFEGGAKTKVIPENLKRRISKRGLITGDLGYPG